MFCRAVHNSAHADASRLLDTGTLPCSLPPLALCRFGSTCKLQPAQVQAAQAAAPKAGAAAGAMGDNFLVRATGAGASFAAPVFHLTACCHCRV